MANTWTVTFAQGDAHIFSDSVNGTQIVPHITGTQSAKGNNQLTFSLTSDSTGATAIDPQVATVSPTTGQSTNSGDISVPLTITVLQPIVGKLFLKIADTVDDGTLELEPYLLNPVTITPTPNALRGPGNITMIARPFSTVDNKPIPPGITLTWTPTITPATTDYPSIFTAKSADIATKAGSTSYNWVSNSVTTAQLKKNGAGAIQMALKIGDPTLGMYAGSSVAATVQPPLDAPVWELASLFGTVVTQELHDACAQTGYPVIIPIVSNVTQMNDEILLYAYDQNDPGRTVKYPLQAHVVSAAEAGHEISMYFPVDTPPFNSNGNYNLAYAYKKGGIGGTNLGDSLSTLVTVMLDNPDPYGPIDKGLTMPDVSPNPYSLDNENAQDDVTFSVNFNGSTSPQVGDSIQPAFHVVGYTNANYNWVNDKTLPAYVITQDDIDKHVAVFTFPDKTSLPPRTTWTAADLAGIDGSNGGMYFKYQPVGGMKNWSSPVRPWTVDTVAPYSGQQLAPEIQKAREGLMDKLKALKK
ncbi:hypothetical protein [Achromobacter aloeverae]|uniref:Uncharacterized protein n=1 Tax=Achromobacter aloeverae TaxID=1750518 RepID=A0A4Q1HDG7_9BURK|nr:hypothetical protein [Achromobacter aloeverae]RXN83241.1 hypothetical protein C7R54_27495 [Achromobacter aloeverae]